MSQNPFSDDFEIEIRPDTFIATAKLKMTSSYIMWGKEGMHWRDVMAVRYGTGPRQGTGTYFFVYLRSTKGVVLEISFSNFIASHAESTYLEIVKRINDKFQAAIVGRYHKKLLEGTTLNIGELKLTRQGVHWTSKSWGGEVQHVIPWGHITVAPGNFNELHIIDRINGENSTKINIALVWNACFLHDYFMKMVHSPEMQKELFGGGDGL